MNNNGLDKNYFVLYKRDMKAEQSRNYENRELYDRIEYFTNEQDAKVFAFNNLPAIAVAKLGYTQIQENDQFIAVAQHYGKFRSYDYTGDYDLLTTYDMIRAEKGGLQGTIESLTQEDHCKQIEAVGLELKLF